MKNILSIILTISLLLSFPFYSYADRELQDNSGLNVAMPTDPVTESVTDYIHRGMGHEVSKVITLIGDSNTTNYNCFQLTGSVEIIKIYGQITTTSTFANATACHFNLVSDGADVDITKNDGVLSGLAIGSIFVKNAVAATTMAIATNADVALTEPAAGVKAFTPFIITQKTGTSSYIRFTYTTSDSPTVATLTIYVEYRRIGAGTLVAA